MVYFSCSGCNESLKKPKVAKHLSFCRRCFTLTCLDCQKDFTPHSYVQHNQCISELEKYSGRNYVEPANANKGQKKQLGWMDSVRAAIADYPKRDAVDSRVKSLLNCFLRYDNIPRKKAKFDNFVKSAMGQFRRDQAAIDAAWAVISTPVAPQEEEKENGALDSRKRKVEGEEEEETNEEPTKKKRKKKKKAEAIEEEEEEVSDSATPQEKENESSDSKKRRVEEEEAEGKPIDDEPKKQKRKKKKKTEVKEEEEKELSDSVTQEKESESSDSEKRRGEERAKKKMKKTKAEVTEVAELSDSVPAESDACERVAGEVQKFSLTPFITDLLQRRNGSGISLTKLEKRAVREYVRCFARPNKAPRPERIRRKLKVVVSKHFRLIDERVFEREGE